MYVFYIPDSNILYRWLHNYFNHVFNLTITKLYSLIAKLKYFANNFLAYGMLYNMHVEAEVTSLPHTIVIPCMAQ